MGYVGIAKRRDSEGDTYYSYVNINLYNRMEKSGLL